MLNYTLEMARKIPYIKGNARVYSVLVDKRGTILAESENLYTHTHPAQQRYSVKAGFDPERCYLHSELRTILKAARRNPKNAKLYVARIGASGNPLPAYPCKSCLLAIRECRFVKSIESTV